MGDETEMKDGADTFDRIDESATAVARALYQHCMRGPHESNPKEQAITARGKARGWVVMSGTEEWRVRADNASAAAVAAFRTRPPTDAIGLLVMVFPAGEEQKDEETVFVIAESVFQKCGIEYCRDPSLRIPEWKEAAVKTREA